MCFSRIRGTQRNIRQVVLLCCLICVYTDGERREAEHFLMILKSNRALNIHYGTPAHINLQVRSLLDS